MNAESPAFIPAGHHRNSPSKSNFVARPFNWLENAEWYHLEEY